METKQISEEQKYQKGIYNFLYETYWCSTKEKILTIVGIILVLFFAFWRWWILAFMGVYMLVVFYYKWSWWWASYEKIKTDAFIKKKENDNNK